MIEQLLELRGCQPAFAHLEVRLTPDVRGVQAVERSRERKVVLQRRPQEVDGASRIVRMELQSGADRRQAVALDQGIQWRSLAERVRQRLRVVDIACSRQDQGQNQLAVLVLRLLEIRGADSSSPRQVANFGLAQGMRE